MTLAALLVALSTWAVKADPQPATVTQSDGTQLTVRLMGDEDFHYYATTDGVLLCPQGTTYYVAAVAADGTLTATTQIAHESALRSTAEQSLAAAQDRQLFLRQGATVKTRVKREAVDPSTTAIDLTGSPKVLVVLTAFADVPFTVNDPRTAFEQYLSGDTIADLGNYNQRNYGSVRQYFADMSHEAFTPQFDVVGPVTLDNNLAYYGAGDDYMSRLIPDVCTAVDDSVDFSTYDSDGDGYADLIYVIYAGYSEAVSGNPTDCIWPKSGTTSGGSYDGVNVRRYGVNNELNFTEDYVGTYYDGVPLISGIGLFCHEFSHCLGLPDLYVTSGDDVAYAHNQEMEYWSVMDSGTYLYNGYAPAAYTAWEREALGWLTIDTLKDAGRYELSPIDAGGSAYRIMNDSDATGCEYYIVENIQQTGWNYRQYGHGMLVTHVDYDSSRFSINTNTVNNEAGHPRMTVLAADGELTNVYTLSTTSELRTTLAGDPFPGTAEVTELTDTSDVYPIVYTGDGLGKAIYDITEDEATGVVAFTFISSDGDTDDDATDGDTDDGDGQETAISSVTTHTERTTGSVYTPSGTNVGSSMQGLPHGVYIINGRKVVK